MSDMENQILQESKLLNKKWILQILFLLQNNQKVSYKLLRKTLQIPNSTLILRVNELVKYKYLNKFIYGSKSKPYYSDYQISQFGLDQLNRFVERLKQ